MATSFVATEVTTVPLDGVPTVGFSEGQDFGGGYLLLQRELNETEQDRRLGLIGTYVEFGDQSRSGYGCVESLTLQRNSAKLVLTANAAAQFKEQEISVAFNLGDRDFEALTSAISQIVASSRLNVL